jgi:hypothetical protein
MRTERIPTPGPIAFLRAIFSDWFSGVSGAVSVPLTIYSLLQKTALAKTIWAFSAIIAFLVACFRVWARERTRVVELHGRPEITIEIQTIGNMSTEYLVAMFNSSEHVATRITLSSLTTENGELLIMFVSVPSIIRKAVASYMDYYLADVDSGQSLRDPDGPPVELLEALKFGSPEATAMTTYQLKLEFSNYGDEDRWQTDYVLECDFNEGEIRFVPGKCRKIT